MTAKTKLVFEGENRTVRAFSAINGSLNVMGNRLRNIAFSARGFVGLLAGGALASATKRQIEFANQVQKTSIRLQASTRTISELAFAAERSNISINTLERAFQNIDRVTGDARRGLTTASEAFDTLRIDANRFSELELGDKIEALAIAFDNVGNNADRINLANALFGGRGIQLLQLLEEGADGIRDLRQEARELGQSLGGDAANRAARAEDAFTNLNKSFTGLLLQLTDSGALDGLTKLVNALSRIIATFAPSKVQPAAKAGDELMTVLIDRGNDANREIEKLADNAKKIQDVFLQGPPTPPKSEQEPVQEAVEDVEQDASRLRFAIGSAISGGAQDGADGMRQAFLQTLQQMFIDLATSGVLRLLSNLFGGSSLGNLLGLGGGNVAGARALGGPVAGGRTYLVGERGPELFTPNGSGRILPNNQLAAAGGGAMTFNVDARGASDPAAVQQAVRVAVAQSVGEIRNLQQRGRL